MVDKFTPGPWKAGSRSVTAPETEDRLGLDVRIYGGNASDNQANARLIAAAPDLLGACQVLLSQYDSSGDFTMGGNLTNKPFLLARAAIEKATSP